MAEAEKLVEELREENEALRLAICGGEDAPGYAASLPLETILQVQRDHFATMRRDSELAWDGDTATSWKTRAIASEAEIARRDAVATASWGDQRDEHSDAIAAAHPMRTQDHATYAKALAMIGTRHGKYELVNLVNWLLATRAAAADRIAELEEGLRPFAEAAIHLHPLQPDDGTTLDGFEVRDFRKAHALLSKGEGEKASEGGGA